jgi:hypothetical protein
MAKTKAQYTKEPKIQFKNGNHLLMKELQKMIYCLIVEDICCYGKMEDCNKALLTKHMNVLQLGTWVGKPLSLPLKPDITPYFAKQPYPIPQSREAEAKATVAQLEEAGILVRTNESEWAAPCFFLEKKGGSLRFICNLREVNKHLVRKPYPLPKI